MKILRYIVTFFLVVIGIYLVANLFFPSHVEVKRSMVMKAPPEIVFEQINNLKNWDAWSPWHKIDSNMKVSWGDKTRGIGASYSWTSEHEQVGNGQLSITKSAPYDSILTSMNFMDQGSTATSGYYFEKVPEGTRLTWTMETDLPYFVKMPLGIMIKKWVGKDYEKGLGNIKKIVEKAASYGYFIKETTTKPINLMVLADSCPVEKISERLAADYSELMTFAQMNGAKIAGKPIAIYHYWDGQTAKFDAGIPCEAPVPDGKRVRCITLPAQNVLLVNYYGSYEGSAKAHEAIGKYIEDHQLQLGAFVWEEYVTDPVTEPDTSKWLTNIYYPLVE